LEIFHDIRTNLLKSSAIALGFFDGVHLGHQAVIKATINEGKARGITAAVVTFRDHPRALTHGNSPLLLTLIEQRLALFEALGVETTLVLTFTEELCRLSAREYVESVLVNGMNAKLISVGYNHHFGRQREGNPQLLSEFGQSMNFEVQIAKPVFLDSIEVSSSKIRECLASANLDLANKLLSRPFSLRGKVVAGEGRGAKLGFPTANLEISPVQMLPAQGVYGATVRILDQINEKTLHQAVANIGSRPTFDKTGNAAVVTEVHLLDFKDNLYHKNLEIYFHKYLRAEKKFPHIDALKAQIDSDCQKAHNWLSSMPNA